MLLLKFMAMIFSSNNNDIVYAPIKVPVCQNCGERYYDRRTMQFLEKVEKEIAKKQTGLKEIGKVLMYG